MFDLFLTSEMISRILYTYRYVLVFYMISIVECRICFGISNLIFGMK